MTWGILASVGGAVPRSMSSLGCSGLHPLQHKHFVGPGQESAFEENLAAVPVALLFALQRRAEGTAVLRDPDWTGPSYWQNRALD